jgi:hypothetical protein
MYFVANGRWMDYAIFGQSLFDQFVVIRVEQFHVQVSTIKIFVINLINKLFK